MIAKLNPLILETRLNKKAYLNIATAEELHELGEREAMDKQEE